MEGKELDAMIRLREKGKLIGDITLILASITKNKGVYADCRREGIKLQNKAVRSLYKDFCKGLKVIEKNIPVYVELPKFEKTVSGCREKGGVNAKEGEEVHHVSDIPQEARERLKAIEAEILGQVAYEEQQDEGPQKPSGV